MKNRIAIGLALVCMTSSWQAATADPCGMVPPVQMIERTAITRIGLQKTYISYHKGVETMVLRPGFRGKVDEFGMLIPFPSPPSLRKVDDNIFAHIAAAVDPPEITAYVMQRRKTLSRATRSAPSAGAVESLDDADLSFNAVKVVNREAVGMYDIAVLAAGSSTALSRWMDDEGFRYPKGMDDVVQDYVDSRWYFVAIKTKVGQKAGVNPRPGLRGVNSNLPAGATFDGHVQAMGFRFKSDRLIVPMRLSAFNPGELRNVVYILTDGPRRIEDIPKRYVQRQISGKELYNNITKPLPLRVIGGTYNELNQWQKKNLKTQRNPTPHNGKAKELFASDLLAVYSGRLANPVEQKEKDLLAIGERLGLRGPQLDQLHDQVLDKDRSKAENSALKHLRKMTMTVVDGDFDRDVLGRQNLTFARYRMPKHRNNKIKYNSTTFGPGRKMPGKLYKSANLDHESLFEWVADNLDEIVEDDEDDAQAASFWSGWTPAGLGLGVCFMLLAVGRRRRRASEHRGAPWLALVLGVSMGAAVINMGVAHSVPALSLNHLIADLGDSKKAEAAIRSIKTFGESAVDPLVDEIVDSQDMVRIGWSIVALAEIGGAKADKELLKLHQSAAQPMLVRTWAAAARIDMAKSPEDVMKLMPLTGTFPSLQRPVTERILATLGNAQGEQAAEAMLAISARMPQLQSQLASRIVQVGASALVGAMVKSKDQNVRRMAAAYLATVAGKQPKQVAKAVIDAYRFSANVNQPPWHGGALFVPGMVWNKKHARALVDNLVRWHLWADLNGDNASKQQIHNNLRSLSLARVAGYQSPGWGSASTQQWLSLWGRIIGKKAMRSLLSQQGATDKYRSVLSGLQQAR